MDALIFDLDDTLVADEVAATTAFLRTCLYAQSHYGINLPGFQTIIREVSRNYWYHSPARDFCVKVGISSWEGLWADFSGNGENLEILRQWAPTYRKLTWLTTLQRFSINDEDFALKLAEKYQSVREELYVVYRDVEPALESLKGHFKLGLLTNGVPNLQLRKIAETGLGKYFDAVVVSGDLGIGKPDKRIFEWMLSRLHVRPDSAMMIGDSLKSDVAGAQSAGLKAAWLNRLDEEPGEADAPDIVLKNLYGLRKIVEREISLASNSIPDPIPDPGSVSR